MIVLYFFALMLIFKIGKTEPMTLNGVYEVYNSETRTLSNKYNVPQSIIIALIKKESAGVPHAIGFGNDIGLGQITKPALQDFNKAKIFKNDLSLSDMFDINLNLEVTVWYLAYLKGRFFSSWQLSLQAYNAGIGNVRKNQNASKEYADDILKNASILKQNHNIL